MSLNKGLGYVPRHIPTYLATHFGGEWKARRDGFGWRYECDDGRTANWYAAWTPQTSNGDETYTSQLIDNTGKLLLTGRTFSG